MARMFFLWIVAALLLYVVVFVAFLAYRMSLGGRVAQKARPFSVVMEASSYRVLVVGDSTGVGTGSLRPEDSVAGRLAEHVGSVTLTNLARNGAKMGEVLEQLESLPETTPPFDLILIQAGGNDILRLTDVEKLRSDVQATLQTAKRYGRQVVFMSTGNVGLAPIFWQPLQFLYDRRTRVARAIFMDVARQENVIYVDLFKEPKDEPFSKDPKRFYAPDGLHPTGDGYAVWFEELKAKLPTL